MANEDKKDFNAMLHDSKDMPKFQIIIDQKSIEKIVVHEAVKGEDGSREQEVEIFYRFIGKID